MLGNGRSTRLLANLVYFSAQGSSETLMAYDWFVEKHAYIDLLRAYDITRDPTDLADFIPTTEVN